MEFIKKHKLVLIVIGIFIVLGLITFVFVYTNFIKADKNVYGNRLDGIDKVVISDSMADNLKKAVKEKKFVNEVEYLLQGRIVKLIIDVKNTDVATAKTVTEVVSTFFNDEYKAYYDFEVYITNKSLVVVEDEDNGFPIIGYKKSSNEKFSW